MLPRGSRSSKIISKILFRNLYIMKLNGIHFFISIERCKPFENVELFLTKALSVNVEIHFLHGSQKYKGFHFIYRKCYEIMDIGFFRVFGSG